MQTGALRRATLALAAFAFVDALATLSAPTIARAQDAEGAASPDPAAEARRRYNLGTQAYTTKRFVEAALNFEAAAYQRPHAVTLYTAALAWEQAGQTERAADDFARALEVSGLSTQQSTNARDRLAAYEAMLGTLVVGGPEGSRVQLDAFTEVGTPARLHGTAGVHSLAVRVRGRGVERRDVLLEVGLTQKVDLEAPQAVAAVSPAPSREPTKVAPGAAAFDAKRAEPAPREAERPQEWRRNAGLVAVGVGGAALVGGVVLGTQALSAGDAYDASPSRAGFDHANALATWTTLSFIAGGVLAAGGVAMVLWPSPSKGQAPRDTALARLRLSPTPSGAVLGGSF